MHNGSARLDKGFTLVEMVVVIALIAIGAVLILGIMGNSYADASLKQTAAKIGDDMRSITAAGQKYYLDRNTEASALSGAGSALADAGYLTTVPTPSAGAGNYSWDAATYNGWKDGALNDTVVKLSSANITTSVCAKINAMFAGAAENAAPPAVIDYTTDIQCFGTAGNYTIVKPVYTH